MTDASRILSLVWSHHEHAVAAASAALVAYFTMLPVASRARIEAAYPRWRSLVALLRDLVPFLPGVPAHVKAIVSGAQAGPVPMPTSSVVPAPPEPVAVSAALSVIHDTPPDGDRHGSIVPSAPTVQRAATSPHGTPRPPAIDGHASPGAMVLCVVAALLASACPNWNRPACSPPGAYSCGPNGDQPHYCARTTLELTPVGDEGCSAQGRVCALNDAGVARCTTVDAGGAP